MLLWHNEKSVGRQTKNERKDPGSINLCFPKSASFPKQVTLILKVTNWLIYLQASDVHALHSWQEEGEREKIHTPFYQESNSFPIFPSSRIFYSISLSSTALKSLEKWLYLSVVWSVPIKIRIPLIKKKGRMDIE